MTPRTRFIRYVLRRGDCYDMPVYLLALLIGVIAGLRSMTAPAAVALATYLGRLDLSGSWLAFFGNVWARWILTAPRAAARRARLLADPAAPRPGRLVRGAAVLRAARLARQHPQGRHPRHREGAAGPPTRPARRDSSRSALPARAEGLPRLRPAGAGDRRRRAEGGPPGEGEEELRGWALGLFAEGTRHIQR
jgi:hypothetical protein